MKKNTVLFLALMAALTYVQMGLPSNIINTHLGAGTAFAEEAWEKEFKDICSKTNDAMSLTKEELKGLIERCERLEPSIEKLEETQRKVYLKRLRMCKELFVFVLESKEKN